MIRGKNIIIYEGNPATAIAVVRSCTIVNKCDVEEKSSPASGSARTYKVGRIYWEISVSSFVTAMKNYVLRRGQTYTLKLQNGETLSDFITGSALCTNVQITATKGNLVQGNLQFVGKDDVSPAAPAPVPQEGADFNDDFNNDFDV